MKLVVVGEPFGQRLDDGRGVGFWIDGDVITFEPLDCCDREVVGHIATTEGIKGEDVRDLMVAAVEQRFGKVNPLPSTIEWLSDNGSCFTAAETHSFAKDICFLR